MWPGCKGQYRQAAWKDFEVFRVRGGQELGVWSCVRVWGRVRGRVRGRYGDSSGMAATGGRVEGNMRLARAIPVADRGSVSYMAAASAMQPAAGLQQLPRLHIVPR